MTKAKVGRPRRSNKVSDARIELRVTPAEHEQLTRRAETAGVSLAEYVRRAALNFNRVRIEV